MKRIKKFKQFLSRKGALFIAIKCTLEAAVFIVLRAKEKC